MLRDAFKFLSFLICLFGSNTGCFGEYAKDVHALIDNGIIFVRCYLINFRFTVKHVLTLSIFLLLALLNVLGIQKMKSIHIAHHRVL